MSDKTRVVTVKTADGKTEVIKTLKTVEITPEQKAFWETVMGERKQITVARIVQVSERWDKWEK